MLNLDSLPLELKFEIYSHLARPLSSHKGISVPVNYDEQKHIERLRCDRVQLMQHPYCQLAATCESLRDSVEAYCLHLIKGQTNPKTKQGRTKIPKSPKDDWRSTIAKANAKGARPKNVVKLPKPTEACRNLYLRSVFKKCIFCGGGTTRRAAFNRFMWCCMNCDIEQYGRLISKTEASTKHQVQEIHWQNPQIVFPESTWRPLRMVLYNTPTCASTTLLVEKEVIEMAAYIKANDPDGAKVKLARRQILKKKRVDETKALIKAEDDFIKFANNRLTAPSKQDFAKAAAFLRAKLHLQVALISRLGPEHSAEKRKLCQNLIIALPQNMRELCKVEVTKRNDRVLYKLDLVRSYNGVKYSFRVLGDYDQGPLLMEKPETIVID